MDMDDSVICLEDPTEVIDLSENLLDIPQNSRDDPYQEFFGRTRAKSKRNAKKHLGPALSEAVIDLSNESDIDLSKDAEPTYAEGQKRKSTDMVCPICFTKYSDAQLKATICGHVFCTACIEECIKKTKTCPKCRKKLTLKSLIPLYL